MRHFPTTDNNNNYVYLIQNIYGCRIPIETFTLRLSFDAISIP